MRQSAKNFINNLKLRTNASNITKDWLSVLTQSSSSIAKDESHRIAMTIACKDSDYIPKVKNAGKIIKKNGQQYQVMHNGVIVEHGGYFGDWMSETITKLKGHHEPQEEKVFYELLKRLSDNSVMLEIGAYWAYYSLWFNKEIKNARNFCCEPDPKNLELGRRNAAANKANNFKFIQGAAGKDHNVAVSFKPQEGDLPPVKTHIKSVDGLIKDEQIKFIDILHMDIQGAELEAIEGAVNSIKLGKVRFVIVSTHHYLISGDPLMHEKCLRLLRELGGHIITEHAIHESFSGDGLIAASFDSRDKDITIKVSDNRMSESLFRSYTEDLNILSKAYEKLRDSNKGV